MTSAASRVSPASRPNERSMPESPEKPIVIRDAVPDDAATKVHILIETKRTSLPAIIVPHDLDVEFWLNRWRNYIRHGSRAQQAKGDGFALLATIDRQAAGFAAYHHTRRWDTDAELEAIYVLPDFQGRGIGTGLFAGVIRRLRDDGSYSLCVGYAADNPYKRFYAKHGAIEINPHWAAWRPLPTL